MVALAAVEVGFEALTVTAVARRLGVSHAALYKHVQDRADLVLAAVEVVTDGVQWPEPAGEWSAVLEGDALVLWRTLRQHPGLYRAVDQIDRAPDGFRGHLASTYAELVGLGFGPDEALLAIDIVYDLAADAAERSNQLERRSDAARQQLEREWADPLEPSLAEQMSDALGGDPEVWFHRKLEVVLAGIRATIAPAASEV